MQGLSVPHSTPRPPPQTTPTLKLWPFTDKHHQHSLSLSGPSRPGFRQNQSRRRNATAPHLGNFQRSVMQLSREREHGL